MSAISSKTPRIIGYCGIRRSLGYSSVLGMMNIRIMVIFAGRVARGRCCQRRLRIGGEGMEEIKVGQVWIGSGGFRKITAIRRMPNKQIDIHFVKGMRTGHMDMPGFEKWITRTGAKLEKQNGEA